MYNSSGKSIIIAIDDFENANLELRIKEESSKPYKVEVNPSKELVNPETISLCRQIIIICRRTLSNVFTNHSMLQANTHSVLK